MQSIRATAIQAPTVLKALILTPTTFKPIGIHLINLKILKVISFFLKSNAPINMNIQESTVPIGDKYMGRGTIKYFTENFDSDLYVVSELPLPMYKDAAVIPSLGACGEMSRRFVEIDIWWSGSGGKSKIHKVRLLFNSLPFWCIRFEDITCIRFKVFKSFSSAFMF